MFWNVLKKSLQKHGLYKPSWGLAIRTEWPKVLQVRWRYWCQLRRVRRVYGKRKLRVIFPVSNVSKWKEQSLYDLMKTSKTYEPLVALTVMDIENDLDDLALMSQFELSKTFFEKRGCKCVMAYSIEGRRAISFQEFGADIVWYTQPWRIAECQDCVASSRFALCCYTPYSLQSYGLLDMECGVLFMRLLWRNFALSPAWARVCEEYQGMRRAGKTVGLGHPMVDELCSFGSEPRSRNLVIYAPHWSCNVSECFSTFLANGWQMLDLARKHPELNWAFKPHPTLRHILLTDCGWTLEAVDSYYRGWEEIGEACYDANYVGLFADSIALITDCDSFLVEYACFGNPIIHLVSSNCKYTPHAISEKLFGTYYQAHDWQELEGHFKRVVLGGDDYKRTFRLAAIREMNLMGNNAARNILDYVDGLLEA